jgi:hypothetical protein
MYRLVYNYHTFIIYESTEQYQVKRKQSTTAMVLHMPLLTNQHSIRQTETSI